MPHSLLAHSSSSSFFGGGAAAAVRRLHAGLSSARARTEGSISTAVVAAAAEGPSCLFVGSIETASKEMLEALYQQEDPSQVLALVIVWILLLALGSSAVLIPTILTISTVLEDALSSRVFVSTKKYPFDAVPVLNQALLAGLGFSIGYPIASSSVQALKDLWMKHLVALKGACPNCGEEVFAFMKTENSMLRPHGTHCHVCQSRLEFRGKVEWSSGSDHRWVYGRVYLCPKNSC